MYEKFIKKFCKIESDNLLTVSKQARILEINNRSQVQLLISLLNDVEKYSMTHYTRFNNK